jgi:hypothetical protein
MMPAIHTEINCYRYSLLIRSFQKGGKRIFRTGFRYGLAPGLTPPVDVDYAVVITPHTRRLMGEGPGNH